MPLPLSAPPAVAALLDAGGGGGSWWRPRVLWPRGRAAAAEAETGGSWLPKVDEEEDVPVWLTGHVIHINMLQADCIHKQALG
jgi:hypothetical protein